MNSYKYCCGGLHAAFIVPTRSEIRNGARYKCAMYQCKVCKEYTIRGETNQVREWTTLARIISAEQALEIKRSYEEYRSRKEHEYVKS